MLNEELIESKIYLIRGKRVILDRDLAELFDVKAIRLREQVKRNELRFPEHFRFQLTEDEVKFMVSQNAIPSKSVLGGSLPYAYTEHGILMLSNVLKSSSAIKMSIRIIEVFVKMRELISQNNELLLRIQEMEKHLSEHDESIFQITKYLKQFIKNNNMPRRKIGFK